MMLRRYHDTAPAGRDDDESPQSAETDTAKDAPQAEKPAGRSRSKSTKE